MSMRLSRGCSQNRRPGEVRLSIVWCEPARGCLNDDQLARLTEEERVEAGLDDYDPDEVPPATDALPEPEITDSET
jgi:hypothetical protein